MKNLTTDRNYGRFNPFKTAGLVACMLGVSVCYSQNQEPSLIQEAEKLFEEKNYYEAAQHYEKYLGEGKTNVHRTSPLGVRKRGSQDTEEKMARQIVVYKLAESYRLYNDYRSAEKWYREAASFKVMSFPDSKYWYGVSLRANKKIDDAYKVITEFVKSRDEKDEWTIAADRELENLRFIKAQARTEKGNFEVTKDSSRGTTSAYALSTLARNSEVFFTSVYADSSRMNAGSPTFSAQLFRSFDSTGNIRDKANMLKLPVEEGYNNGLPSLTGDGNQLFFTRWKKENGIITSSLYSAKRTPEGDWTSPARLSALVNEEGSNSTQPFITADGKYLLFSSNRSGGFGKYDLWVATLGAGQIALSVQNLGIMINTPGDESSPWYHPGSGKLVFSSNSLVGMGGFDLFSSEGNLELNKWNHPVNPGSPINSVKDDQYYVGTDELNLWASGWLSSDRESDCCLELFRIAQDNIQYITGTVVDKETGEPLEGAYLYIQDPAGSGKTIMSRETDSLGRYSFELSNMPSYNLVTFKDRYDPDSTGFSVRIRTGRDSISNDTIRLTPITVYDPDVGKPKTDPPDIQTLQDSSEYREKEPPDLHPEPDSPEQRDKEPPDKIFDPDVGSPPGFMKENLFIARFDFDRSEIKKMYYSNLDSLVIYMKQHPSIIVDLDGHTDAFGSDAYNMRLSDERLASCITYLVAQGIGRERLTTAAHGERMPMVRETINGSDYATGRSLNRRVEFRIVRAIRQDETGNTPESPGSFAHTGGNGNNQGTGNNFKNIADLNRSRKGLFHPVVRFNFDIAEVDQEYYDNLDRLADMMKAEASMRVEMSAYTDGKGSNSYNLRLAQERLDAVISYLGSKGISSSRLSGKALGECCPLEAELVEGKDNPQGRWMNRRVEFKIIQSSLATTTR
ncbi:MAG: OmpA family protein [Chitinophagaceae bacterium]